MDSCPGGNIIVITKVFKQSMMCRDIGGETTKLLKLSHVNVERKIVLEAQKILLV
jgi:hypothetical protein